MQVRNSLFFLVLLSAVLCQAEKYTPIVLVHGVMSNQEGMTPTEQYIRKHMGNEVYIKNIRIGVIGQMVASFSNVYHQVEYFRKEVTRDPKLKDGFNLIAHSQGGLVSRYYMQRYNDPQVLTYISWGSPQQGIYGLPGDYDIKFKWLDYIENYSHHILYSNFCQSFIGFAGYWHDIIHYDAYLKQCTFLPYANNHIQHTYSALFKENIIKLKNMVLVMSTEENIVEPRISCHFGFYSLGSKSEIQELFDTDLYKQDLLGLKTLHESGRLHLRLAHCTHENFQEDENNFIENTLEYLKADPNHVPLTAPGARIMQARA